MAAEQCDDAVVYDATANDAEEIITSEENTVSTALALVTRPQPTREEIEALKDTLKAANREMTDAQFKVFMAAARHLELDPLARQVVPVFQGGKMTVQTTIDGFRLIAERTRKYRGQVGPFWCGPDGVWREVWLDDGAPAAAKVGVKRSDFDEVMWGVARYKSYAKGGNWNTMPDVMIAKVAEALALRKTFPAELSGAYTDDEMAQATGTQPAVPLATASVVAATPQQRQTPRQRVMPAQSPAQQPLQPAQTGKRGQLEQTSGWVTTDGYDPHADVKLKQRIHQLGVNNIADFEALLADVREHYRIYDKAAILAEVLVREGRRDAAKAAVAKANGAQHDAASANDANGGHDLREAFPADQQRGA